MANELLEVKGDIELIGDNWPSRFLTRHPKLKSVFIDPRNRNRQLSEDPNIITYWFQLYKETVDEHNIEPEDTYNMDEKGAAMGLIAKERCIVSKSDKTLKSV
jgi:hypothetical protein